MTLDEFKTKIIPRILNEFEEAYLEAQRDDGERDYPSDQSDDEWVDALMDFLNADDG